METARDCDGRHRRAALKAALAPLCGAGGLAASPVQADPTTTACASAASPGAAGA
jgi:hypothetical protein